MYFNEIVNSGFATTKIISSYTIFCEKITSDMMLLLQSSDPKVLKAKIQELEDIATEAGTVDPNFGVALNAQKDALKGYYTQMFKTKMTPGEKQPPESDKNA